MNEIRRSILQILGGGSFQWIVPGIAQGQIQSGTLPIPERRNQPVPIEYFGLHIHDPDKTWPIFRFGQLRLWDSRTSWFQLQPERDRWDWGRLDSFVQQAEQRGIRVLLPLGMPPTWASARPTEKSPYNVPGASAEPADLAFWTEYVQTVARRYKGRIRHFEIWNEVNAGSGFFTGSAESMFLLQRVAYQALKEVDPGVTVLSPSTEGSTEDKFVWFERYMGLMAGRYADAVAYHFYNPRKPPEAMLQVVARVQAIMQRTGNGKLPLWNTESGYRIDWGSSKPLTGTWTTWPNLAPQRAAAWLARAYLLGWIAGLDSYFWYAFNSSVMGMVPVSGGPSVVSDTLGATMRYMTGRVVDSLALQDGVALVRCVRGASAFWWVWSTDDSARTWRIPPAIGGVVAQTLTGVELPIVEGRVDISDMPVLVASDFSKFS